MKCCSHWAKKEACRAFDGVAVNESVDRAVGPSVVNWLGGCVVRVRENSKTLMD